MSAGGVFIIAGGVVEVETVACLSFKSSIVAPRLHPASVVTSTVLVRSAQLFSVIFENVP